MRVEGVIIVDMDGNATIVEDTEVEIAVIDLVDYTLLTQGPQALKQLLDMRSVALSFERFMAEVDEYVERYHG